MIIDTYVRLLSGIRPPHHDDNLLPEHISFPQREFVLRLVFILVLMVISPPPQPPPLPPPPPLLQNNLSSLRAGALVPPTIPPDPESVRSSRRAVGLTGRPVSDGALLLRGRGLHNVGQGYVTPLLFNASFPTASLKLVSTRCFFRQASVGILSVFFFPKTSTLTRPSQQSKL